MASVFGHHWIELDENRIVFLAFARRQGGVDLRQSRASVDGPRDERDTERLHECCCRCETLVQCGGARGKHDCNAACGGQQLVQQLQPFAVEFLLDNRDAGHVAARPRQALGEAGLDEVRPGDHDDRDRVADRAQRPGLADTACDDRVEPRRDELSGGLRPRFGVGAGNAPVDGEVPPLDPAEPCHGLVEIAPQKCGARGHQADAGVFRHLLCHGGPVDRRGHRRREQEVAPVHFDHSSAPQRGAAALFPVFICASPTARLSH